MRMHDEEADIDAKLVAELIAGQFPRLSDLRITAVESSGTVNAIYRLGAQLCARLPRVESWVRDLEKECAWLPKLAPHLSLGVPTPVAMGRATSAYPFPWAIYRWIDGVTYAEEEIDDEQRAAADLARFVAELRRLSPLGGPRAGRRPLHELDAVTRAAIDSSRAFIDPDAAVAAWENALAAPPWDGSAVWIHGDLLRPNVLVTSGRVSAVIDFGTVGVGDPATDVVAAWSVFGAGGRGSFRGALNVDDGTWRRARGIALHQAAMIIPYYLETNPGLVRLAQDTVREVVADLGG